MYSRCSYDIGKCIASGMLDTCAVFQLMNDGWWRMWLGCRDNRISVDSRDDNDHTDGDDNINDDDGNEVTDDIVVFFECKRSLCFVDQKCSAAKRHMLLHRLALPMTRRRRTCRQI